MITIHNIECIIKEFDERETERGKLLLLIVTTLDGFNMGMKVTESRQRMLKGLKENDRVTIDFFLNTKVMPGPDGKQNYLPKLSLKQISKN